MREEGRGPITWAILTKSYDPNLTDIYIAWRFQCVKSVRETSCAFSPATFLHFVTSHQNPWLATPAMRHGFWLPLWLCRVTWGLMCTGFTCGSQEATSAPRLNPKRTWNSERPYGTRWGFSMVKIQTKSMGMVNMPAKERPKLSYFQGLVTISRVSYLGFYFEFKAMMSCMLNVNQVLVPKYHKGTCTFAGELQQFSSQYFVFSLPMMIIQKSPLPIVAKKHSTWLLHFLLEIASVWHCEPLAASHVGCTILEWCNVKVQSWKT